MREAIELKSYHAEAHKFGVDEGEVEDELSKCSVVIEGVAHGFQSGWPRVLRESHFAITVMAARNSKNKPFGSKLYKGPLELPLADADEKIFTALTKRVGGAFGGKASQSLPIGAWAAVAAHALHRPVSVVLNRNEDMLVTGKRHPAIVKYRVGLDTNGMLRCAHLKVYIDGGYACDTSPWVTFVSAGLADACYNIPVMRVEGYTMKTNKSNNTAFRGTEEYDEMT
ncbi:hypothetical protein TELCIR_11937 [Teladorsagia circumcincta]|uniref:Aldehyde oxidase/xanthine dehydrogenase first molybdopterin binding domain-containing protein n=1 Tax=Teladorsagia circumcincta TaxID=45464 RepID=A0A2G9U852_TELCI|nr:hypothetical protein TELCIR_11937 [Teladorsagia circumcincta]